MNCSAQSLWMVVFTLSGLAIAMNESRFLRAADAPSLSHAPPTLVSPEAMPAVPVPWWREAIQVPLGIGQNVTTITADEAVIRALTQSPDIEVINLQPQIQRTEITRQQASFDWNNFLESSWYDRNDPIGSRLTTGSVDGRFKDQQLSGNGGVRKTTTGGTEIALAERMGWQANNSAFLVPNGQNNSRLELTLTQPLMSGRGQNYNLRRVFEAKLITEGTQSESIARVQEHLLTVHQSYWELYRARAAFLQRKRAADRAAELAESLVARSALDTTGRQLVRSNASAAQLRAELMRAASAADFAAIELRRLIGSTDTESEVIPIQSPSISLEPIDTQIAIQSAMAARPEIAVAVREIRVAGVRLGASKNELMPRLDLIAGAYVAGLAPSRTSIDSLTRQFADGRPSYSLGLAWERPAGNRAAKSSLHRRHLEMQEAFLRYETAVQDTRRDVEIEIHRLHLSYQALLQRHESLAATQAESDFLLDRWQTAPTSDGPAILLLEDLIAAQSRLADEEVATLNAEVEHAMAQVRYLKAIGSLLQSKRTLSDGVFDATTVPPNITAPLDDQLMDAGMSVGGELP